MVSESETIYNIQEEVPAYLQFSNAQNSDVQNEWSLQLHGTSAHKRLHMEQSWFAWEKL